jgi:UDP-glucose 4-epimerase
VVNLRLFNVFGSRQVPDSPYSGVISIFVKAMQRGLPISIYGDGTQTRDFVYVRDVATAFSQALTVPLHRGQHITCNIGTGQAISILQLIRSLNHCFPSWRSEVQWKPARLGDIQRSVPDISKAMSYLSFKPEWSLHSGLEDFIHPASPRIEPALCSSAKTNSRIR